MKHLGKLLNQYAHWIGIGKKRAILIGLAGILYAWSINDALLMTITIGFTILSYIIFSLDRTNKTS